MASEWIIIILLLVLIGITFYILNYLKKRQEPKIEDIKIYGQIMKELSGLKTSFVERSKKEVEAQEQQKEYQDKIFRSFSNFERVLTGTKRRGTAGENILKEILSFPIKVGVIITNLHIDGKTAEFAWKLSDGRYIPIDSKLPEIEKLYNSFEEAKDSDQQKKIKKEILAKIQNHIQEIKEYRNKTNTIDKVILAIPDGLMDLFPELAAEMKESGVIVCGYSYVFFFAYYLAEAYQKSLETGDIADYQQIISLLENLMQEIKDKTYTIDKGLKIIDNANKSIKENIVDSERHKIAKRKKLIAPIKMRIRKK